MARLAHQEDVGEFVSHLLHQKPDDNGQLLQFLIAIQEHYNFLPEEALERLSEGLNRSLAEIDSIISFYSFLQREPARYRFQFSDNITDRMLGSQQLAAQLQSGLSQHTDVKIDTTSCTGLCDQGPALLVNGRAIARLNEQRIARLVELVEAELPVNEWPAELFEISDHIQRRDAQMGFDPGHGDALGVALESGPEWLLHEIESSGLRGRGGAGFPSARKWRLCRGIEASDHVVVCNADEGEPGTFKDRVLLRSDAHSVIEGMTLCAFTIGASHGYIYLRGEYRFLLPHLNQVLNERRAQGLLGNTILGREGFDFDITIHLGAGAYICGEESALIESLEGKRGIPRVRPPFPVQSGYMGLPTVVNNVETFWSATRIAVKGADWFRQFGTTESAGTRLLSISGDCARPGIYEYPFGTRIDRILQDCGGQDAQAVQIAGAAGNLVPASEFSRCLSFEDLPTGGSFMVLGPHRDLLEVLDNFAAFFRHESCGFCTPCRNGTAIVADIVQRFRAGDGCQHDLSTIEGVLHLMQKSSFCGLGCSAPTAFLDAMQKLPALFSDRMASTDDNPRFDLEANLTDSNTLLREQVDEHA
jgi:[NiFe] hydrogenase diaphorase moiety large subunit